MFFLSFYFSVYWAFVLIHFMPLVSFDTPENITKPMALWYFQRLSKDTSGMKLFKWMIP